MEKICKVCQKYKTIFKKEYFDSHDFCDPQDINLCKLINGCNITTQPIMETKPELDSSVHKTLIWVDWGDDDTKDLKQIWENTPNLEIVRISNWNEESQFFVETKIEQEHGLLILCGHGTEHGLLAPKSYSEYIVHEMNVQKIKAKYILGVFCYAAEFAQKNNLHGLFSSMFVSNVEEAVNYSLKPDQDYIKKGNSTIFHELNKLLRGEYSFYNCQKSLENLSFDNYNEITNFNADGFLLM